MKRAIIGKLVLTNRRVIFLSSGRNDGFGITETTMIKRIAKSLDITALQRKGSWEFAISEVGSAEVVESFWSGPYLRVVGIGVYGREVEHKVYRSGMKRKAWEEVAAKINEIRQIATGALDGSESHVPDPAVPSPTPQ